MTILQNLRYGARLMLRNPGYAAISVFTLAVGIGLTGMVFSILNGALLKGLPFEDSDGLMSVPHPIPGLALRKRTPCPARGCISWRRRALRGRKLTLREMG